MQINLSGCRATPFGHYLKALAVLRLVSVQADKEARGWWHGDTFQLSSRLDESELERFFLTSYSPTPILAPWNAGSGFYEKDRKIGVDAIAGSGGERFAGYRDAIRIVREIEEVQQGKAAANEEDARREKILRVCRNELGDRAVAWIDAAVGIAADGSRAFAPVLGTGGNEGRLDYTNNFMERVAGLLLDGTAQEAAQSLLGNALFGRATAGLQPAAAGQYDPGRAGGANQGEGIEADSLTNPWDFILALEGAVSWASGLYRRQGVSFRAILCSPFTVEATRAGYESSSRGDDSRAEIWTPLWNRPTSFAELRVLLREGRADVGGRPAKSGIQFAQATASLGVNRGIDRFVRYSLLRRRGDSYVALPAGTFQTGYRSTADRVREIEAVLAQIDVPPASEGLKRALESAMFEALRYDNPGRTRELMAALGRLLRRLVTTGQGEFPRTLLGAEDWLTACGAENTREVRIAAALASIWDRDNDSVRLNLIGKEKAFAWYGRDLSEKLANVLEKRILTSTQNETRLNPTGGAFAIDPGDVTVFIEGTMDDSLIEDLFFGFACLRWKRSPNGRRGVNAVLPVYALLKHLFMAEDLEINGEKKSLRPDPRILPLLRRGDVMGAAEVAKRRLRAAGLNPIETPYLGGVDEGRLAAALLIPITTGRRFSSQVMHTPERRETESGKE